MVKVGDTVKWDAGSKGMLGGKVTGGEKGKRWKIEKAGKTYYVLKDKVKKGVVKKVVKKPAAKKPVVNKEVLQNVMGIMAEVAKEKGKSTKKEVDSKVALDKKAIAGKLTQKAFLDDVTLAKGYDEKNDDFFDDMSNHILDDIGDNAKTESQMEKAVTRASNRAYTEIGKYRRRLFNRVIKGKKFKSFKEAQETFLKDYHYNAYFYEDD